MVVIPADGLKEHRLLALSPWKIRQAIKKKTAGDKEEDGKRCG
jgi:hypothetical protein